jgi:4-diphosphocytidyl-2-C-methyl-D-erythritol kinase
LAGLPRAAWVYREGAPAKVNLTLHVLGRRSDGWHELDSLVAFAGVRDWLEFTPSHRLSLTIGGPAGAALGADRDNLVLRAARALQERVPALSVGDFRLLKHLPVAGGLGGGSSDAAATLRLLCRHNRLAIDDSKVLDAARAIGADVPVCLEGRARAMSGVGERLAPLLDIPPLFALLVNPKVAVATPAVFAELALAKGQATGLSRLPDLAPAPGRAQLLAALAAGRNDLEQSARALAPAIGETLGALSRLEGARLARMSGSGATCFALFDDRRATAQAKAAIAAARPGWWARATILH